LANLPWNVNIHYDALLESKVPLTTRRLLCGRALIAGRASG
jgi:hypothetical protein